MSSNRVPRYSLEDDLEEAAERVSRDLPEQIARIRAHVREAKRRLLSDEDESSSNSAGS